MDPPPLPTVPTAEAATIINTTTMHLSYPDSVESSPRSSAADTFNEPLPPVPGAKLRIMCSYGGHIIPRPHDKSLCYVGGETRMVAIDRHSTLASLCARLSRTLVHGRTFTLKYQLPNEDLDSLVSITTDEDLDNMIEEYDRITGPSSALAPIRIRLFLFFNKPETTTSMGSLLDDAKSETWFIDALNDSGLLQTNLSDSATMECLVSLDNDQDSEAQAYGGNGVEGDNKEANNAVLIHDMQTSLPDSPMVENSSSFGSSSSSPSMCNLPPIRVRVEDQKVGIEEQFAQMTFAQAVQKQVDGHVGPVPPLPTTVATATVALMNPIGGSSENLNRMLSDDERSDHGVPVAFRKPPLAPLQSAAQQKAGISYGLPSPDSVASDTSIASASSLTKPAYYHDQQSLPPRDNRTPSSPDTKPDIPIPSSQVQIQQVQNSGYAIPEHQQHFFHTGTTHFFPHPATTQVPMTSYYPVYATSQQQPPMDQQYPVYVMPISQTQPYMSMQPNMVDNNTVVASSHAVTPSASVAYKDAHPPVYPTKIAAATTAAYPEMAATVYRTAATTNPPPLVQIQPNQFQQPFVMQHPHQSIAVAPTQSVAIAAPANSNYNYEYANTTHDQVYYPAHQHQAAAPLPPQYQTMTPTAAAAALADASSQLSPSNAVQQIATSQPL